MTSVPPGVVRDAVARALAEDLGPLGDITADLLDPGERGTASFIPRKNGVLAGTACATETFAQVDAGILVRWRANDGDTVVAGEVIGTVEGPLASILTAERTALNFLCHLSGVATLTRRFVDAASETPDSRARIWDTRKTLPGLRALEKAAVRAGGGVNHRATLSEMVLVKDNHLGRLDISEAVRRARERWPGRSVEVECERMQQVLEAVDAGADLVMLDNMVPEDVAKCVAAVEGRATVEVSGGITLETVGRYAATGADLISTSVITQSAPAFDIGLDLDP
jgi:nicotinate-nucleotide pyrophosphorylase (carboxylating)